MQKMTGTIKPFGQTIDPFKPGDAVWYFNSCRTRVDAVFVAHIPGGNGARITVRDPAPRRGFPALDIEREISLDNLFAAKRAKRQPTDQTR